MIAYKGTDGMTKPEEVECEKFGYPNRDIHGQAMYDNTHFRTLEEAWESIRDSVSAGVKLAGADVARCRDMLAKSERQAGTMAIEYRDAMDGYAAWKAGL